MALDTKLLDTFLRVALATVLLVSAAFKIKDRSAYDMAVFVTVGPLRKFYKQLGTAGLVAEILIGLALCIGLHPLSTALACLALMLVFDAALLSMRLSGYEGGCGCFGSRSTGGVTLWHFLRNVALSTAAAGLVFLRTR
jgi:hypothetical protein